MSKKNKNKFKNIWANQTNIGKLFGLSAVSVGKKLIEHGLRDKITKKATEEAIRDGFAKETPLKDGTYFCTWNKEKIKSILSQEVVLLTVEQRWINEIITRKKMIDKEYEIGNDKIANMAMDFLFDEVPKKYLPKVINFFKHYDNSIYTYFVSNGIYLPDGIKINQEINE